MKTTILTDLYEAPETREFSVDNGMILCVSFPGSNVEDWEEEDI